MNALIVEGEPGIRRLLRDRLHDQGVEVTMAGSVGDALAILGRRAFKVVILDLTLPDGSGLDVLDGLRASGSGAHVIIVSDSAADEHRTSALERGADDFVVKPYLLRELTARVLAVRRQGDPETDSRIVVGPVSVDLKARLAYVDERPLELTAKEFDLLAYLAARPGHAFSRDELLRAVWHSAAEWQKESTVTEHVRRLRAKVEQDPRHPRLLRTVRGTGYRLDQPAGGGEAGHDPEAVFAPSTLIHVDGRIVRADRAAGALLGIAHEADLLGRQIVELASPASKAATRESVAASTMIERRTQLIDLERTDGTEVSVEVATEEIEWKGQPARRIRLTHRPDLSARLRRLVTGVLSELTDAVIITDLHFHLRSWNQAAERLYGWKGPEVLGRHVLDVLRWVGDDGALAASWENLEVKGRWKGEVDQVTRDGSVITVLSSTTLVRDDAGEPMLIVSVNRPAPPLHELSDALDDEEINRALVNDEFEVHYQPVMTLDGLRMVTMEALVRWNHPERGQLPPAAFLVAAERSGAIVELGYIVLEKACRQAAEWRREGADIEMAVNLSARQLADPGLFDRITATLALTGLGSDKLWLEVTETALVEEVDRASEVLYRLADLGIGIAIDDFGTGWASLTYLSSFPVHALKIDRTFVLGVGRNANDTAIARSVLSLGAELGLFVVAEGIETEAQHKAMRKLGCTLGQGYLFGRPGPASEAPMHLAGRIGDGSGSARPRRRTHLTGFARVPLRPTVVPITRISAVEVLPRSDAPGSAGVSPGDAFPIGSLARTAMLSERVETDAVASLLRGLLRIDAPLDATELLHGAVRQLGGLVVSAAEASADALPVDLSLDTGPPMVAEAPRSGGARMSLERLLPGMADDARHAIDLLCAERGVESVPAATR